MIIPVPKGTQCTVSGSALRTGACRCGCQYTFLLQRTARGEGSAFLFGLSQAANQAAREKAAHAAQAELQRQLRSDADVPCPVCGCLPAGVRAGRRALIFLPFLIVPLAAVCSLAAEQATPLLRTSLVWGGAVSVIVGAFIAVRANPRAPVHPPPVDMRSLSAVLVSGRGVENGVFKAIMEGSPRAGQSSGLAATGISTAKSETSM